MLFRSELDQLKEALKSGQYDLVVGDLADAAALEEQVRSVASQPTFLPIMYKASKAEASAAQKRYMCLLKAPNKIGHYLSVIDDAMALRLKSGRKST